MIVCEEKRHFFLGKSPKIVAIIFNSKFQAEQVFRLEDCRPLNFNRLTTTVNFKCIFGYIHSPVIKSSRTYVSACIPIRPGANPTTSEFTATTPAL
jgi:hypothetical protein